MKDKVYWVLHCDSGFFGGFNYRGNTEFINDVNQAFLCLTKKYAIKAKEELKKNRCDKITIIPVKRDTTIVE